jgi:ATP-dependent DNA ligase
MEIRKLEPMLAQIGTKKDLTKKNWYYEAKLDGKT